LEVDSLKQKEPTRSESAVGDKLAVDVALAHQRLVQCLGLWRGGDVDLFQ